MNTWVWFPQDFNQEFWLSIFVFSRVIRLYVHPLQTSLLNSLNFFPDDSLFSISNGAARSASLQSQKKVFGFPLVLCCAKEYTGSASSAQRDSKRLFPAIDLHLMMAQLWKTRRKCSQWDTQEVKTDSSDKVGADVMEKRPRITDEYAYRIPNPYAALVP